MSCPFPLPATHSHFSRALSFHVPSHPLTILTQLPLFKKASGIQQSFCYSTNFLRLNKFATFYSKFPPFTEVIGTTHPPTLETTHSVKTPKKDWIFPCVWKSRIDPLHPRGWRPDGAGNGSCAVRKLPLTVLTPKWCRAREKMFSLFVIVVSDLFSLRIMFRKSSRSSDFAIALVLLLANPLLEAAQLEDLRGAAAAPCSSFRHTTKLPSTRN